MAFKLEGFDADWVDAGTQRVASYTNLPPGRYTFRVKATNADGVANEAGRVAGRVPGAPLLRDDALLVRRAWRLMLASTFAAYRVRIAQLRARRESCSSARSRRRWRTSRC